MMLLLISALIVLAFSPLLGLNDSYRSFSEPSSIPQEIKGFWHGLISVTQAILGLVCTSTFIALISQAYNQELENIKKGHFGYRGQDHIVLINYSEKIWSTLEAFNQRYQRYNEVKDLLIMVHNLHDVEVLMKKIETVDYSHLKIYIKNGDLLNPDFYESCSVEDAYCVLALISGDESETSLQADNFQTKIASSILQSPNIREMMKERMLKRKPIKVTIELKGNDETKQVIKNLCRDRGVPSFLIFESDWFKNNLMGMAMIDTSHLGLFNSLNNYLQHGIYIIKANDPRFKNIIGKTFAEAYLRCSNGALMGVVDTRQHPYRQYYINPEHIEIHHSMELIFITKSLKDIYVLDDSNYAIETCNAVVQDDLVEKIYNGLTERHSRHVLIIGNDDVKRHMGDNLDIESMTNIKVVNPAPLNEMRTSIREMLEGYNQFDTILINMPEEESYALYMELNYSNIFKPYDLSKKILVLLNHQDNIRSIRSMSDRFCILNENAVIGEHLGQICFQTDLMFIYNELITDEGNEFYFIKNNEELRGYISESLMNVRVNFINKGINYVGVIDKDNNIRLGEFDQSTVLNAKYLIAMSKGKIH